MVTGARSRLRFLILTSAFHTLTTAVIVFRTVASTSGCKTRYSRPSPNCYFKTSPFMASSSSFSDGTGLPAIALDRSQFDQRIPLVALNIPAKLCTAFTKELRAHVLTRPKVKKIYDAPGAPDRRLLVLSEEVRVFPSHPIPPRLLYCKRRPAPPVHVLTHSSVQM